MFELVPFKKEHLEDLKKQKINAYLPEWIRSGFADEMEKTYAFTGLIKGKVMVCGGVTSLWKGRGHLWCLFSEESKDCFLPVFRGLKKFLNDQPFDRVEMSVPCDFEKGKRRALLLGFEQECERAKKYLPNGQDCTLFAKVRSHGL